MKKNKLIFAILFFGIYIIGMTIVNSNNSVLPPEFENGVILIEWSDGTSDYENITFVDDRGYYEIDVAPGTVNSSCIVFRYRSNEISVFMNETEGIAISGDPCEVWQNYTFYYPNDTALVYGYVKDNYSNPINNANVEVVFQSLGIDFVYGSNYTTTNESGYYELGLPSCLVSVLAVTAEGYESCYLTNFYVPPGSHRYDFTTKATPPPPPQMLLGWVKGFINNFTELIPLDDVLIIIEGNDTSFYDTTFTNETGYYSINLSEGHYDITVIEGNEYQDASSDFWIYSGINSQFDFDLIPYEFPTDYAYVEGYVTDEMDNPIIGAIVDISGSITDGYFHEFYYSESNFTDINGYYNIPIPAAENNYPFWYSEINSIDFFADGYIPKTYSFDPAIIYEPLDVIVQDYTLYEFPEENCILKGYVTVIGGDLPGPNQPPEIISTIPTDNEIDVQRPPVNLSAEIIDLDGDSMDVYIRWKNHTGDWLTPQSYFDVTDGTYEYIPSGNNWIWGDTTYTWSVNVTDGKSWTNETYIYTTGGSRYDVSNNGEVNFQDAGLCWIHRDTVAPYDGLYDVNQNGVVNFQDAGIVWINRD